MLDQRRDLELLFKKNFDEASHGNGYAMMYIADCFLYGWGTSQDYKIYKNWLNWAASFGVNRAYERLFYEALSVLFVRFSMRNRDEIKLEMKFSEDCSDLCIKAEAVAKIPIEKLLHMCEVINDINLKNRWIKFYINKTDGSICAQDDAVIQIDSCGEEAFRCCEQMVTIIDEEYPLIMRSIYSGD